MFSEIIWRTFFFPLRAHLMVLGATLGITDKMEARPQTRFFIPQACPGMKELGLVILNCLFLSSAEVTEKEY